MMKTRNSHNKDPVVCWCAHLHLCILQLFDHSNAEINIALSIKSLERGTDSVNCPSQPCNINGRLGGVWCFLFIYLFKTPQWSTHEPNAHILWDSSALSKQITWQKQHVYCTAHKVEAGNQHLLIWEQFCRLVVVDVLDIKLVSLSFWSFSSKF